MTLQNGEVDKGSKSFKDKALDQEFNNHYEKRAKELKRVIIVEQALLDDAVVEWEGFCQGYITRTKDHYIKSVKKFLAALPGDVVYINDLTKLHINVSVR